MQGPGICKVLCSLLKGGDVSLPLRLPFTVAHRVPTNSEVVKCLMGRPLGTIIDL